MSWVAYSFSFSSTRGGAHPQVVAAAMCLAAATTEDCIGRHVFAQALRSGALVPQPSLAMSKEARIRRRLARRAGLRYSHTEAPGYVRKRKGEGFVYLSTRGKQLSGKRILKRINGLVIPPAWNDVWICRHANGHIQATGRDARGRLQYRYHDNWPAIRDVLKFHQLLVFAQVLPQIRRAVAKDMAHADLSKHTVLATSVRILDMTAARVGNARYTEANQSFGLTTWRSEHVEVHGKHVDIHYIGKGGKTRELSVDDPSLAKALRKLLDLPGQSVFSYRDKTSGELHTLMSDDVNHYLQEISGEHVTAKTFRTWRASVAVYDQLLQAPKLETKRERTRVLNQSIADAAALLGHTKAVCRSSYVHPTLVMSFMDDKLPAPTKTFRSSTWFSAAERQFEWWLKQLP